MQEADVESELAEEALAQDFADDGALLGVGLDSSNTVHDRNQFESKFDFATDASLQPDANKTYEIDLFFFVPKSLGVSSESFPRDRFYANLTQYLRLQAPELVTVRFGEASSWSLASADRYLAEHLKTFQRKKLAPLVEQDVRLFGCFVYTHYKRLQVRLRRQVRNRGLEATSRLAARTLAELWNLEAIVEAFRERYVHRVRYESLLLDDDVKRAFLLVDEYVSYRRESALIGFYRIFEGSLVHADVLRRLEEALEGEIAYRQLRISTSHSQAYKREEDREAAEREVHYYRLGLLKKYVSSVLFLASRPINRERFYRNAIGAVGASLAALWATLAQIQTAQMINGPSDAGVRLGLVVLVGVVAYVFKDRIKEISKEYFNEKMKHRLPDVETQLFYPHVDANGEERRELVGTSSEVVRYLSRGAAPAEVLYVRDIGHQVELEPERNESVIHYQKRVTLNTEAFRNTLSNVRRIHDVVRFDVSEFLHKLSDPDKSLSYFDAEEGIRTLRAPKVYHLNLVYRYTISSARKGAVLERQVEVERVRLVLNKKGIVRIEEVLARGELGYSEGGGTT